MQRTAYNSIIKVAAACLLWLVAWSGTQGIFMSDILLRLPGELNLKYLIATIWVLAIVVIALIVTPSYRKKMLPKSNLLWFYVLPAILLFMLPAHYSLALDFQVFVFMILATVFWQEYVTFGLLQTYLAMRMPTNIAAIAAALLFLFGHAIFFLNDLADPQIALIALAGFIFAFSQRYTGSIYVANVLHLCFYLI